MMRQLGKSDGIRLKPMRSLSGVSVITAMVKPVPCPKPEVCIYCPGGPAAGTPQSYTGKEPACMRALQHGFDPYRQVAARIRQLEEIGHRVDKVDLIIFGGTLTAYPREYLENFIKRCLDALNGCESSSLEEAKKLAEVAPRRVSNMVFETRPDWCRSEHLDLLLELGGTRVELGVQILSDEVYRIVKRGHTVGDVAEATKLARDAGFAVTYHLMTGLPGSSPQKDLESFRRLFEDADFRPDGVKIYPTMILPGTELHERWKRGEYSPYSDEELVELLVEMKRLVPPWVRIHRILRDIPLTLTAAGPSRGDLRMVVQRRMEERGERCRCIRCREIGHVFYKTGKVPEGEIEFKMEKYGASGGEEFFLTLEKGGALLGLLRLRLPSGGAHRPEVKGAAVIRQLQVFGEMVPVGLAPWEGAWQHRGLGGWLLKEAEELSRREGAKKLVVLSGLGVKSYYRKFGFEKEGPYMSKRI
jgi:elongator complex protein 3